MFGDVRGCRVVLVAHCLLNQNSIVPGLARFSAVAPGVVELLSGYGLGIFQLPCPETLSHGLMRWWMTREQYDNPGYRSLCRKLCKLVAYYALEYTRCGVEVVGLVGIAGSPSCGVNTTSTGWTGGEPVVKEKSRRVKGRGVFTEILLETLRKHGIKLKFTVEYDYNKPEESLKTIEQEIKRKLKTQK